MAAPTDCFVSVVAPIQNDAAILPAFIGETMALLRANYANYELVLVDDGSTDDSVAVVDELLRRHECVRLVRLSRRCGFEVAITAGLETVIGDFVAVAQLDCDPPALIPEMVAKARAGSHIVYGVLTSRAGQSPLMRAATWLFYRIAVHFFRLPLTPNATVFRVLSRQAVNAVIQIKDKYRFFRLLSASVGFRSEPLPYRPVYRYGRPRQKEFLEALQLAVGIIVSNTIHPLRFASLVGLLAAGLNGLYALYIVGVFLFKPAVAPGWTTLSLQVAGMFFAVCLILAFLCEYVGRILEESRDRPLYYILEEHNSSVLLADQSRRNVVADSPPDAVGEAPK